MSYDELLDELVSPELLKCNQTKLGTIFQILGEHKGSTL